MFGGRGRWGGGGSVLVPGLGTGAEALSSYGRVSSLVVSHSFLTTGKAL